MVYCMREIQEALWEEIIKLSLLSFFLSSSMFSSMRMFLPSLDLSLTFHTWVRWIVGCTTHRMEFSRIRLIVPSSGVAIFRDNCSIMICWGAIWLSIRCQEYLANGVSVYKVGGSFQWLCWLIFHFWILLLFLVWATKRSSSHFW